MAGGAHLRREPGMGLGRQLAVVAAALVMGLMLGVGLYALTDDDGSPSGVATRAEIDLPVTSAVVDGSTAEAVPDPGPITLAFVGDIYAEGGLRTRLEQTPEDFVGPFAELLREADLAIGNLEAAVTTGGRRIDKQFTFRAPPSVLDALEAGGIDVASAANNHGMDFGEEGLADTLAAKAARADGMLIGVGADEDEAYAPFLTEVGGQRVAVIAATQVLDGSLIAAWTARADKPGLASAKRVDRLVQEIETVRPVVDTVVVYLHWGIEREVCPSSVQQELAVRLADAGADVIVGGHAHRVQSAGRLGNALVGYGLGNFLFTANNPEGAKTGVLLVTVDGRDVLDYEWRPGRIVDQIPRPLEGDAAAAAVRQWDELRDCTNLTG